MTVSIASTRSEHDVEQLVFASDSHISAGEKFNALPEDAGAAEASARFPTLEHPATHSRRCRNSLANESYPDAMKRSLELSALKTRAIKIFNATLKESEVGQSRVHTPLPARMRAS